MILTKEQIIKIKKRYIDLCSNMDDFNNKYELYEIYDGFNQDENPDFFKTHKTVKQRMDIVEKKLDILQKFAKESHVDLWSEFE